MSVTITGINIPKSCSECDDKMYSSFWCEIFNKNNVSYWDNVCKDRYENCPLKSIDDLIKKIDTLNPIDYGSIASYEAHNGAREMKNDILKIIEEYCEVK